MPQPVIYVQPADYRIFAKRKTVFHRLVGMIQIRLCPLREETKALKGEGHSHLWFHDVIVTPRGYQQGYI